jgi:hypothetical protein
MRYVIEYGQVKDVLTNSTIKIKIPNNIFYRDNTILYNPKEDAYYLASMVYLFNETDEEITDEIELVYNDNLYCLTEIYSLPSFKFIGLIYPTRYPDLKIDKTAIINENKKIKYVPTKNGIKIAKLNRNNRAKQ